MRRNELAMPLWPELLANEAQRTRNQRGQYMTPPTLAHAMLAETRRFIPNEQPLCFLDPAFGTGVFYDALQDVFPTSQIARIMGIEVDPVMIAKATRHALPVHVQQADFTMLAPPHANEKPNLIVCNPPYVRHHHLNRATKQKLQRLVQPLGIPVSGLAGLYSYFLLLAHDWLADDGIGVWLLPGEWLNVNYGKAIREYLTHHVTLLRMHIFDSAETQFDDALVSSTVVWFRKRTPSPSDSLEMTFGGSLAAPQVRRAISHASLDPQAKWASLMHSSSWSASPSNLTLGDLFTIKRGIATGANNFFIVSSEQLRKNNLPKEWFVPILPPTRFLQEQIIWSNANGEPTNVEQRFLLRCEMPESVLAKEYPALWHYLESGKARGVHTHYLCAHRSPWYRQEQRLPAPLLCTYMGRQSASKASPFRFILNHTQAIAPNTYLMLYPKGVLAHHIQQQPLALSDLWVALQTLSAEELIMAGRSYGGGLFKLEPKELAKVPVPIVFSH